MLDSLHHSLFNEDDLILDDGDDKLIFAAEDQKEVTPDRTAEPWKIMIVDDEPRVHQVTKHVLNTFTFEGKSLSFISAYSGEEAKRLIAKHPDTAFILLDVVMEENDSGLMVAKHIREVLQNQWVRLILRTGQPGSAPQESVILDYEINDYKSKTELTRAKLFTTIVTALRSYRDLTSLEASREALRESEEKWRTLVTNAPNNIAILDLDGTVIFSNQVVEELTLEQIIGTTSNQTLPEQDNRLHEAINQVLSTGIPATYETKVVTPEGNVKWWANHLGSIKQNDQIVACFVVGMDISQQKRAEANDTLPSEEQIKASLREKEVLLGEIHHRVKNNLQIISSLLYLQSKKIKDSESLEMFKESQNRVKSMALMPCGCYQSRDLAHINFADYIRQLTRYLFRSYRLRRQVTLQINAAEIFLTAETAIPCGLIINELVSNALKHAFPTTVDKPQKGEIRLDFHSDNGQLTLIVADNGIGLPQNVDFQKPQASLGLQLVKNLVRQLDGTIEARSNRGTQWLVTFRDDN